MPSLLFRRLAVVAVMLGCTTPIGPDARGQWGGTEASLALTGSGGTASYLCGAGTIDSGWTITQAGDFEATGQHFFGGGPLPIQGRPPHPARYVGRLSGTRLTLTVILLDTSDSLGPFHLIRGGPWVNEACV
jgi:hypothetical protein